MQDNFRMRIYDTQLRQTTDYDLALFRFRINGTQLINLKYSVVFRNQTVLRRNIRCDTADVERTKRQLCSRLTNRLCGNDTNDFTFLHHLSRCQVTPIAQTPFFDSQVSTERISTLSIGEF